MPAMKARLSDKVALAGRLAAVMAISRISPSIFASAPVNDPPKLEPGRLAVLSIDVGLADS